MDPIPSRLETLDTKLVISHKVTQIDYLHFVPRQSEIVKWCIPSDQTQDMSYQIIFINMEKTQLKGLRSVFLTSQCACYMVGTKLPDIFLKLGFVNFVVLMVILWVGAPS